MRTIDVDPEKRRKAIPAQLKMTGIHGFLPRAARTAIKRPRRAPVKTIERVALPMDSPRGEEYFP